MLQSTNLRKAVGLFIKTSILLGVLYYIVKKISETSQTIDLLTLFQAADLKMICLVLVLMPLNWCLEAKKWQRLILELESVGFGLALKSVLGGLPFGLFTPSRIGAFVGRLLFLKTDNKIAATGYSLFGSIIQLIVTLEMGLLAAVLLIETVDIPWHIDDVLGVNYRLFLLITVLLSLLVFALFYLNVKTFSDFVNEKMKHINLTILGLVWTYSFLRYIIFSVQFFLLLEAFHSTLSVYLTFLLIMLTFFVTTVIPSSALSSLIVRGGVAVFFFSAFQVPSDIVIVSSSLLWLINLGVPALAGSVLIAQLKITK